MRLYIYTFILFSSLIHAQSTGYMGKRFLLGYGFHTSPAIFGATPNNETIIGTSGNATTGSFAFNTIHEGFLEFAASSKWMICFSTRYYKTAYDNALYTEYVFPANSYNSSYFDRPEGFYNIRGLTYTLYFKYYGSRYVAPWGRYVMFGPTINTVKTSYDPAIMNLGIQNYYYNNGTYSDTLIANFGPKEQNFTGVNLMLGFGRSRIIANRVVVDYGCNLQLFSVISGAVDIVFDGEDLFSSTKNTNTGYIENTYNRRVRGVNRFNVFLKVGILLF
jgi:hypothetical protein